jgi:hypothetical protein
MRIRLAERSFGLDTDRALLKHQLKRLMDYPEAQIPRALKELIGQKSERAVHQCGYPVCSIRDGEILWSETYHRRAGNIAKVCICALVMSLHL